MVSSQASSAAVLAVKKGLGGFGFGDVLVPIA